MEDKTMGNIAEVLVLVGAANWGLLQFAKINLVEYVPTTIPYGREIVYGAIAASAVFIAYTKWMK
jgi:uncharacterized membrane protein YuzA (DUF378 family)